MNKLSPSIENNNDLLDLNLGKLFYSVAMADKRITPEEIASLKSAILKNWHIANPYSKESNLEAQYGILSVFTKLQQTNAESNNCFKEFRLFFIEHQDVFNEELRKLIWHTAQAIASSYAKKNKSELVLLAKLKMLLQSEY
ncbi:hypothetical protein [Maribacter sp. HTCC2170]|uniref:hypothetical protein n=1 Tax=Maribacter sp. (strain HTCC2170 / KCCM 42371) TaxID=313603 RepID=UPI00006B47B4|nr:hypothetical protein [Maribacter sp. HTCC2170]EAR01756.1 hypothetical protein FB2170_14548 [Maribacter sp. HTCC2170]